MLGRSHLEMRSEGVRMRMLASIATLRYGDEFLFAVAQQAILSGLRSVNTILYQEAILKDCLKNPVVVAELYNLITAVMEETRRQWWPLRVPNHLSDAVLPEPPVHRLLLPSARAPVPARRCG